MIGSHLSLFVTLAPFTFREPCFFVTFLPRKMTEVGNGAEVEETGQMKLRTVATVAGMILGLVAGTAQANTIVDVNGSIQGHTFSAVLNLNVQGNTAVSGTGTLLGMVF